MSKFNDVLLDTTRRSEFVRDICGIVDAEVSDKKGLSGLAVKAAFKTVKAVKPNMLESVLDVLFEEFVEALTPIYDAYVLDSENDLFVYFTGRSGQVADALLSITDRRAQKSKLKGLVKAYEKLRPQGTKYVSESVPRLSRLLQSYGL